MDLQTIILEKNQQVATVWLNRPEKHNAFNGQMIDELIQVYTEVSDDPDIRIIILRGKGKSFCAGADVEMMREIVSKKKNSKMGERNQLSTCLQKIYQTDVPTIAVAHGSVFGGGNGLIAACDIVLAETATIFSFSEVKLGLIPAVISPFVIRRIGEFHARDFMLTGRRINTLEAEKSGLINHSYNKEMIEQFLQELINNILQGGEIAVKKCKSLIDHVVNRWSFEEALLETEKWIRDIRASEEAQERMNSFLKKKIQNRGTKNS